MHICKLKGHVTRRY